MLMPNTLQWSKVCERLQQGATLITANRRQARILSVRYAQSRRVDFAEAWERPDILSWTAWIQRVFADLQARGLVERVLLNSQQTEWLWLQIIQRYAQENPLLNQQACARQAMEAWQLIQDFDLDERALQDSDSRESRAMLEWSGGFRQALQKQQSVDTPQLPRLLTEQLAQGHWAHSNFRENTNKSVITYGFIRLVPTQRRLLEALVKHGYNWHELDLNQDQQDNAEACSVSTRVKVVAAQDDADELQLAAEWARDQLQKNPAQQLQVVIPDLMTRRQQVNRVFQAILHPEREAIDNVWQPSQQLFDLTAGEPLADQLLLDWFMNWAALLEGAVNFNRLSRLLRSPLIPAEEQMAAAEQERKIRLQNVSHITLAQWLSIAGEIESTWYCPRLLDALRYCQTLSLNTNNAQPLQQAIEVLQVFLENTALSYLDLDELEVQRKALQSWYGVLDGVLALTTITPVISLQTLLIWIQRQLNQQVMQVKHPAARVQVCGVLEALGQPANATWVMQLTADDWPAKPKPNPLLPIDLQRRLQMPRASAAFELEYAQHVLQSLCESCDNIVFSYATQKDTNNQLPSQLLSTWVDETEIAFSHVALSAWITTGIHPITLNTYIDEQISVLPVTANSEQVTKGGSGLLKAQAACPFKAAATYRLSSEPLRSLQPGINALLHGNALHLAMQVIWSKLMPTELADKERCIAVVNASVVNVLEHFKQKYWALQNVSLLGAYREYLQALLLRWLAYEHARESSFSVLLMEQQKHINIGPLRLQVKLDRVDQMSDGRHLYLDYKSAKVQHKGWYDDALYEPQLPLYAFEDASLAGIAVASLHPAEMGFISLTDQLDRLPDAYTTQQKTKGQKTASDLQRFADLPALQTHWKMALETLAVSVQMGDARVAPLKNACQFCQRESLCRIDSLINKMQGPNA